MAYTPNQRVRLKRNINVTGRVIKNSWRPDEYHVKWDDTEELSIILSEALEPWHYRCSTCSSDSDTDECEQCEQHRLDYYMVPTSGYVGEFP